MNKIIIYAYTLIGDSKVSGQLATPERKPDLPGEREMIVRAPPVPVLD